MAEPIYSIAVFTPHPGKDQECLRAFTELKGIVASKGYGADHLYQDAKRAGQYVFVRQWNSPETRSQAQQDPDMHRVWARLPELCEVTTVYEVLRPMEY